MLDMSQYPYPQLPRFDHMIPFEILMDGLQPKHAIGDILLDTHLFNCSARTSRLDLAFLC
jgi:hypothetical protein